MRNKKNKSAFTIVELIVVILVVAILVAVLVPTFISVVNKAKLSVDKQTVDMMNIVLISEEKISGKPDSYEAACELLRLNGLNVPCRPVATGYWFYWDSETNRVLLWEGAREGAGRVIYPDDIVATYGAVTNAGNMTGTWTNLWPYGESETSPTNPSETTAPTNPSETTASTDPSETTVPTNPSETTVPTNPSETTASTNPSETTVSTNPSETTAPTNPSEPTYPGIVNGLYYGADRNLYTGTVTAGGETYEYQNGILVIKLDSKQYTKYSGGDVVGSRTYNYTISSSEYLTNTVIIDGDNSSYENAATINITDNTGKNYTVQTVKAIAPFGGLLDKNGWTTGDITGYLMNNGGQTLISNGYQLTGNRTLLTGYSGDGDDPDRYDIFIPKLCADSPLVQAYFSLTGCSNVADYYSKYNNGSLMITLADYMRLVYGKGYVLTNESGTIKYSKSFGDNYQSGYMGSFYVTVTADASTALPNISFNSKSNGTYITAPTTIKDGKLVFCNYIVDGVFGYQVTNGQKVDNLEMVGAGTFYMSITEDTVIMRKNSMTGQEYCKFVIDNENHVIYTYMNGTITDANGLPFALPSSGTVSLVDGKISLTGAFDVSNAVVPASAVSDLVGSSNSSYLMFEPELIELTLKAAYKGTMSVYCNDVNNAYNFNNIPSSVFTKSGNTLTAKFENGFSGASILPNNMFNGVDYAGTSYKIILSVSE